MEVGEATDEAIEKIKSHIQAFKIDLRDTGQDVRLRVRTLVVDDDLIQLDRNSLSRGFQTIRRTGGSWSPIASREPYLCTHSAPDLCIFCYGGHMINAYPWTLDQIKALCWSWTLDKFLIITEQTISTVGIDSPNIERRHTSQNKDRRWSCATCSSQILYLSTMGWGAHVYEYTISPGIRFVKRWSPPTVCAANESIDDLKYRAGKIAMIINCYFDRIRLELRSSSTFERLWSYDVEAIARVHNPSCCPIDDDRWLVIDGDNDELLFIDNDGQLSNRVPCQGAPRYATQLNENVLALSTTFEIRLHQF